MPFVTVASDGAHNAFPSLLRLDNGDSSLPGHGDMWIVWRRGSSHNSQDGDVYRSVSIDNGVTWSPGELLFDGGSHDLRNAAMRQLRDGVIVSASSRLPETTSLLIHRSEDLGATWQTIHSPGPFPHWIYSGEGGPVDLPNGDILLPVYGGWFGNQGRQVGLLRSTDRGLTWPHFHLVHDQSVTSMNMSESVLLRLADGTLLLLIRRDDVKEIWGSTSDDEGATWSPVTKRFDGSGKPSFVQRPDGTLLCHYRGVDNTCDYRTSADGGATWSGHVDLYGAKQAYADQCIQPNGQSGFAYAIEGAGASVWFELLGDPIAGENVAETDPTAGTLVDAGITVTLTVPPTPPPPEPATLQFLMQNFVGWAPSAAQLIAEQMGFVVVVN